jgi:hypothetical protein
LLKIRDLNLALISFTEPWGSVGILIVGGLLSFALASYLFSWDSENSTRRGHPALAILALVPYLAAIFLF